MNHEELARRLEQRQKHLLVALDADDEKLLIETWRNWKRAKEELYNYTLVHVSPFPFARWESE